MLSFADSEGHGGQLGVRYRHCGRGEFIISFSKQVQTARINNVVRPKWLDGIVVRSRKRSQVRVPSGPLSSNNLKQVIYTHGSQANSAFHPSGVGK